MIVISDTTPIITFLKLGRLDILQKLFGTVLIPNAVYDELTKNIQYLNETATIHECSFLQMTRVFDTQSVKILNEIVGLDAGESEAIALFNEHSADLLIIDERKGRNVAKKLGIRILGSIGILLKAFDLKIISKTEILSCVELLKSSKIRISENLFKIIFEHIGLVQT